MAKPPKWMIFAGAATVALVAYTFLSAPDTAAPRRSNNVFRGGSTSRAKTNELFRPEDYTAKFPAVNVQPKNAFKPLVAKTTKTLATDAAVGALPNGIPASFTGGDANWIYTGNAEVNGVPNALLENTASGDSVFLRPGERWRSLTVARISENQIELLGPTGQRRSVRLADETASESPVAAAAPGGTSPGTLPPVGPVGLNGPIGAAPNGQAAPSGDNRTNRPQRRNRRNNRNNGNNANPAPTFGNP